MHDVTLAVAEARRSVTELGVVAVSGTPNPVNTIASLTTGDIMERHPKLRAARKPSWSARSR